MSDRTCRCRLGDAFSKADDMYALFDPDLDLVTEEETISSRTTESLASLKTDIDTLESERNSLAKNANMGAIAEYRKKEADYLAR